MKKKTILVSLAVLLVAAVIAAVALNGKREKDYALSEDARDGTYTMDELSEHSKSENFAFQINGHPVFASGGEEGTLMIRNPVDNGYDMQVTITLDEDGSQLYESDMLSPGQQVGYAALEQALPKGDHAATAVFHIRDLETGEDLGETQVGIKITVES